MSTTRSRLSDHSGSGATSTASPRKSNKSQEPRSKIPVSLQTVQENAETTITKYNSRVEKLHDKYKWEELLAKPEAAVLYEAVKTAGVAGKFLFKKDFDEYCAENSITFDSNVQTLLDELGGLYDDFKSLISKNIQRVLSSTITDGLCRYCLPLSEVCDSDFDFVHKYEKDHVRFDGEVTKDANDLYVASQGLNKLTFLKYLKDVKYSTDLLNRSRSAINKLYYLVTEWADADRSYVDEMNEVLEEKEKRLDEVQTELRETNDPNIFAEKNSKKQQDDIEKLEDTVHQIRVRLSKCTNSISSSRSRLGTLKEEERQKLHTKEDLSTELDRLEALKQKQSDSGQLHHNSQVLADIAFIKIKLKENSHDIDKSKESLKSLNRYLKHQERSQHLLETDLAANKEKLSAAKNNFANSRAQKQSKINQVAQLESECQTLTKQVQDLRVLKEKKTNPSSLRELHNTGHVQSPRKVKKPIVAVCQEVAEGIGTDWRVLYGQLPMDRTHSTRRRDVERMDIIGGRHDATESELANMSLEKWRMFCPTMKPQDLLKTLNRIDRQELANQLKHKYKYKQS